MSTPLSKPIKSTTDPTGLTIAAVERETALSKDLLRKREAQYGIPAPLRNVKGERLCPTDQMARLRLIKRLRDTGLRPARIVGEAPETLAELLGQRQSTEAKGTEEGFQQRNLQWLRRHDVPALRLDLYQPLRREWLPRFVQDKADLLTTSVGEAWSSGELQICEKRLFGECMRDILGDVVAKFNDEGGRPRMLLTPLLGEAQGPGLLLASALMSLEGARYPNLIIQSPSAEIGKPTWEWHVDLVALSFNICDPIRHFVPAVEALRVLLPGLVDVWIGGNGADRASKLPQGGRVTTELADVPCAVAQWHASQATADAS